MANHKSAQKRNRQRVSRTARARALRSRVRAAVRDARTAIDGGEEGAATKVKSAVSLLDRAAAKNVIPFKRVSRLKGRLAAALHKQASAPAKSA